MMATRSVKCKLINAGSGLQDTFSAYTAAFNTVCDVGYADKDFNSVSLHHKTYKSVRQATGLPSQLAITARMKASEALKQAIKPKKKHIQPKCPHSKQAAIRYDQRSYSIDFHNKEVSLLTLTGRQRFKFAVGDYFTQYLSWRRATADVFMRRGVVFMNIVFTKEFQFEDLKDRPVVLGVDRGIKHVAVTSDNKFYSCKRLLRKAMEYKHLRKCLQKKGTRSAKRHLAALGRKENRFRTNVNHSIAKKIVSVLPVGSVIVLEKLRKIKKKPFKKVTNSILSSWSFYQLEQFLTYKAAAKCIAVDYVDARYTSQKCSRCGYIHKDNRKTQSLFRCQECGKTLNADLNASRVIRDNYLSTIRVLGQADVNQPIVAGLPATSRLL